MSKFIVLEGIDGSGKSTEALRLKKELQDNGNEVVLLSLSNKESIDNYLSSIQDSNIKEVKDEIDKLVKEILEAKFNIKNDVNIKHILSFYYTIIMETYIKIAVLLSPLIKKTVSEGIYVIADRWIYSSIAYNTSAKHTIVSKMLKSAGKVLSHRPKKHIVPFMIYRNYNESIEEHQRICRYIKSSLNNVLVPDKIIYMHIDVDTAMRRILKRGEADTAFETGTKLKRVLKTYEYIFTVPFMYGGEPVINVNKILEVKSTVNEGEIDGQHSTTTY